MPWFESTPGVVHTSSMTGGIPGDICPQGWDENFDRSQMSTQVMIGRQQPSNIPTLTYYFPGSNPPSAGQLTLVDSPATMLVARIQNAGLPADVTTFLGFLKTNDTVRITSPDNTALGYRVTGTPVQHAAYYEIPIFWESGSVPVTAGTVFLTMQLSPEVPQLWIDTLGKSLYGVQTFNRTDLINSTTDLFETLADRILEVRGVNSVPRIEAVTIDARTGFGIANMELMSTAAPEKPSRYLLRLAVDERPIFDRQVFVSGVRHFISNDEWTLRLNADVAEWAGTLGT